MVISTSGRRDGHTVPCSRASRPC